MKSVASRRFSEIPVPLVTSLACLPRLVSYSQQVLAKGAFLRAGRGVPLWSLALLWLVLAWRGSGRATHLPYVADGVLALLAGLSTLPCSKTLARSLHRFPVRALRQALEAQYLATVPRRSRRWVALDTHQLPFWGRVLAARFRRGWSGARSRSLRGYRLAVAVDTHTGQVVSMLVVRGNLRDHRLLGVLARHLRTRLGRRLAGVVADSGFTTKAAVQSLLAARIPFILGFARTAPVRRQLKGMRRQARQALRGGHAITLGPCPWDRRLKLIAIGAQQTGDQRGPWTYVTNLTHLRPNALARLYRRRWCAEQAIEELLHGMDLDHLVSYSLHPNRIAVLFRVLARNLQIGYQLAHEGEAAPRWEWRRMRSLVVEHPGWVVREGMTLTIVLSTWGTRRQRHPIQEIHPLPWIGLIVRLTAAP